MFEKLNQISDRVFNRYVTVEKNIKAASNSFYDSYTFDVLYKQFFVYTVEFKAFSF